MEFARKPEDTSHLLQIEPYERENIWKCITSLRKRVGSKGQQIDRSTGRAAGNIVCSYVKQAVRTGIWKVLLILQIRIIKTHVHQFSITIIKLYKYS